MTSFGRTLLSKVFLAQAAILCLVAVVVPTAIDAMLRERVSYFEHKVLSDRASLLAEALVVQPDGRVDLRPVAFDREGEKGEFGYAVVDGSGTVHLSSSDLAARLLRDLRRAEAAVFDTVAGDSRSYDAISRPVTLEGRSFWVLLGWDTSEQDVIFDDVAQGFLWRAAAVTAPLLALLLLADMLMLRRFFRPVRRLSREVRALDLARPGARLPASDLPEEIGPLALAYNAALEKLEQSYRLQKEFTADAAHELRTPMAILDARLQTLPPSKDRDALIGDVRLMTRIVNQLLDMAKLDQTVETREETDLIAVCQEVVAALAPEAIKSGRSIGLATPDGLPSCMVLAREQDVWHMVRNLVENAIRHTGPGTSIDVVVEADGTLIVKDDGPGIPEEMQPHIFKRFWRAKRSGGSGAGLGMAIVQRVAQANGGTIALQSREGEGTRFTIRLPRP